MDGSWIESYGYWALLLGGILEGEVTFIAAGYAVSREYLHPLPTFLVAAAAGSMGDLIYYSLGRLHGPRLVRSFPLLRRLRARATLLLRRWGRAAAFLMRFAYGLRVVLPMITGATRFPFVLFLPFNLLGSACFAALYLALGYLFGETVEEVVGRVRAYEGWILLGLVAVGALVWAAREWRLFHPREGEVVEEDETE